MMKFLNFKIYLLMKIEIRGLDFQSEQFTLLLFRRWGVLRLILLCINGKVM